MSNCIIIQLNYGNLLFVIYFSHIINYHFSITLIMPPCHLQLGQNRHILKMKMYLFYPCFTKCPVPISYNLSHRPFIYFCHLPAVKITFLTLSHTIASGSSVIVPATSKVYLPSALVRELA